MSNSESPEATPGSASSTHSPSTTTTKPTTTTTTEKSQDGRTWILIASASGACAAINGVFAKLTTTELTSSWAVHITRSLGLELESSIRASAYVEYVIRGLFLTLNVLFNGLMWSLFTMALTRATSSTSVSIVNTSVNFLLTAIAGWIIFREELNALWLLGAGMLVVGNVIIGRRELGGKAEEAGGGGGGGGGEGGGGNEVKGQREKTKTKIS